MPTVCSSGADCPGNEICFAYELDIPGVTASGVCMCRWGYGFGNAPACELTWTSGWAISMWSLTAIAFACSAFACPRQPTVPQYPW